MNNTSIERLFDQSQLLKKQKNIDNPIKSKERVNIDGPKLMVGFVLMPSISLFSL